MSSNQEIVFLLVVVLVSIAAGQRAPFAGARPQGYKDRLKPVPDSELANRFGSGLATNAVPLPVDALGDAQLVQILSQRPVQYQPYWFVNYPIIEANRARPYPDPTATNSIVANSFQGRSPFISRFNRK